MNANDNNQMRGANGTPTQALELEGDALKEAVRDLAAELRAKMLKSQNGVGTFYDLAVLDVIASLERLDEALPWEQSLLHLSAGVEKLRTSLQRMKTYLTQRSQGRYVEYRERVKHCPESGSSACGITYFDLIQSQGTFECMQWKGLPLFKTVYDFSIYTMMLWRIRPRTIIELGSGTGASALWLADLATTFGFNSVIYSVDLVRPDVRHEGIRFIEGDCREIDRVVDTGMLQGLDHPLILIEDAHVNVFGVLTHFHPHMSARDYIVVEDSAGKQGDVGRFLMQTPDCYMVDTYYTDFFGRNATCAQDSFLVRV